jgi:hypothetical protein
MMRFFCCCPRRPYAPLASNLDPIDESSLLVAYEQLKSGKVQPVRDLIGSHMESWSWLMNSAVDEQNIDVIRHLVNDCGVHILYWPMAIYCDAARRNDAVLVDVFLDGIVKAQPDPHYCMTRPSMMLQHAAEGGHMDLVRHIDHVMRDKFGFPIVRLQDPERVARSIAAECERFFSDEAQLQRTRALYDSPNRP